MKKIKTIIQFMQFIKLNGLNRHAGLMVILLILHSSLFTSNVYAQEGRIVIGGNVYGGGNQGNVDGNTTVVVKAGDIQKVFGGARMADVGGRTFVNIYGEKATGDIFIFEVYGGNDIAGSIGASGEETTVPLKTYYTAEEAAAYNTANSLTEGDEGYKSAGDVKDDCGLTEVLTGSETKETHPLKNAIDNTWKTFVRTSRSAKNDGTEKNAIFIGKMFGGGNGDFDYEQSEPDGEGNVTHRIYNRGDRSTYIAQKITPEGEVGFQLPEVSKTYLEIMGGNIAHLYGGGNNVTITENTTISINNQSDDAETQAEAYAKDSEGTPYETTPQAVIAYLLGKVNLSTFQGDYSDWHFNFARVFGGNNKADMAIQPTWNLQAGKIRDLYSGGNQGRMTYENGLFLNIKPEETNPKPLVIGNVYGGCRMADVRPLKPDGTDADYVDNITGYYFPRNLAARTLVQGGDIGNVYGGNDIRGKVYFGNAVGVTTSIRGDIYGGGNGAYAYTDNPFFKDDPVYGDFYYSSEGYNSSVDALNGTRPDAEQVSIMVRGTEEKPTVIGGSIYCGGNCATLETEPSHVGFKDYPMVELKIGSHVVADNVFLGNNGTGMVKEDVLKLYHNDIEIEGGEDQYFSTLDLTDAGTFNTYMEGAAMDIIPKLVFEDATKGDRTTYEPYTSYIGSFFCGGNVGSMTYEGKNSMMFDTPIVVYNKVVGGCNNASVKESAYNAFYDGGILGSKAEQAEDGFKDGSGNIKDRLEITLNGVRIEPKRLNSTYTKVTPGTTLTAGKTYYSTDLCSSAFVADGTEVAGDVTNTYYELTAIGKNLVWNTVKWDNNEDDYVKFTPTGTVDMDARLLEGNIFGGCYKSGHVNGNVAININQDIIKKNDIFQTGSGNSNVDFHSQRDDVETIAMTVFGAGYGEQSEIWGSTTVNLNKGYAFQVFGGGERGVVGKGTTKSRIVKDNAGNDVEEFYRDYMFDPAYSATINLQGSKTIYSSEGTDPDIPESEYLYAGGNEGNICGNTYVNLGNGRIYDAFGGCSAADVLGHTEVYIGRQPNGTGGYKDGFPWIRDVVYGGNDFSGTIWGEYEEGYDFTGRLRSNDLLTKIHNPSSKPIPDVLQSSSYIEYYQGRVDTIFGGGYGYYDYTDVETYGEGNSAPYQESAFVNIRPNTNENNHVTCIFGGGTGFPGDRNGDKSQDRSYMLIDIPESAKELKTTEVFGAGSFNGIGMHVEKEVASTAATADQATAVIDLINGSIANAYGGSYHEGVTRRTMINVPAASTINIGNIFGGAYGTEILPPCDVYESYVNYRNTSENARVTGAIYGGNNNERRTLYAHVNISSPVWSDKSKGYLAKVYGAGYNIDTWSEYTEVNLESGAKVYEVYGGGNMGHVLNAESVQQYMDLYKDGPSPQISTQDPFWKALNDANTLWETDGEGNKVLNSDYADRWAADWEDAWTLGDYYTPNAAYDNYIENVSTNLNNPQPGLVRTAEMDNRDYSSYTTAEKAKRYQKYNTNVIINEGATVVNYAYGGGYGQAETNLSGDVYGNTYIALLGGTVTKDIYAAGTAGAINDLFGVGPYNASTNPTGFTASANAYIYGGTCRNVYGGGWLGNVGHHTGALSDTATGDIPGETHVVIGDKNGTDFTHGIPAVQRNAYGGGEGGAVFGTAHLKMNNGYVGYEYNGSGSDNASTTGIDERYEEKIEDNTQPIPNTLLTDAGCLFGGGYIDNSSVDKTEVSIYGGHVRGSAFGGGEIAAIGRGSISQSTVDGKTTYTLDGIYRPGKTNIEMFGGQVHRNVFGGGRGYDNLGKHGTLFCDGYVFGQTEVHIHGGEIGTVAGLADGDGNVFGGCDIGYVYSAYEEDGKFYLGKKSGVRYNKGLSPGDKGYNYQGYYYKHKSNNVVTEGVDDDGFFINNLGERHFTEDCKVLVEPHMLVKTDVTINGNNYTAGQYVPIEDLNTLGNKETSAAQWNCLDQTGIIIHNAVFAGGNTPSGALVTYANTASVFGNATASIHDIYNRDMITLGTRHTGGLYGDGNLTLVDGYRELNITNYGTDYYNIAKEIGIDAYHALPNREADYYELKYTCIKNCQDKEDTRYKAAVKDEGGNIISKASTITADEMQTLFVTTNGSGEKVSVMDGTTPILKYDDEKGEWVPNDAEGANYWEESGVLPVYAGRLMNSIQRADFCGVFGSRMVMQGAQDRVPEEADYTNYTINRVREVSLNKKKFDEEEAEPTNNYHGNYFGIYNIVNYLGALTSDVDFGDDSNRPYARTTDNTTDDSKYKCDANNQTYGTASFYDWKKEFRNDRKRNNGNSHNKVALASGVYLELTTEESTGTGLNEKVWGPITGVVELDLINVSTGIGGGFVYAKNEHGVRTSSGHRNTTLTELNENAVTHWDFDYSTTEDDTHQMAWETSGNFVHSTQTIIDDCYNISNKYMGTGKVPAHYWYIKGSVYVYDQYISAYTGTSNAYSEAVNTPLTIAAASHGKMKLLNVMPNRYAYFASPGIEIGAGKRIIINDKSYYKNDPISYWDWYLLSPAEKELFVTDTYVTTAECTTTVGTSKFPAGTYPAGTVLLPEDYNALRTAHNIGTESEVSVYHTGKQENVDFDFIFRPSNNLSHDNGYILTYEVTNPNIWDNWYTPKNGDYKTKKNLQEYNELNAATRADYENGPTYRLNPAKLEENQNGIVLGQRTYKEGELISKDTEDTYQAITSKPDAATQAVFEKAYIVTSKITVTEGTSERHYNPGTAVPKTFADEHEGSVAEAYICLNSVQLNKDDFIYKGSKMTKTEAEGYVTSVETDMNTLKAGASALTTEQIKALEPEGAFTAEKKKSLVQLAILRDELNANLVSAYYCKTAGLYGGNYYKKDTNYRGLEAWSSMTENDRDKFIFNYDALDLLIDPTFETVSTGARSEGHKYQYDGPSYTTEEQIRNASTGNKAGYSVTQSVDYSATYNGGTGDTTETEGEKTGENYMSTTAITGGKVYVGDELTREQFESLPNEQRYYAPVAATTAGTYYVVRTDFQIGSTPYAIGETISAETYTGLPTTEKGYITQLVVDDSHKGTYYYCRESYTPSGEITTVSSSDISGAGTGLDSEGEMTIGTLINSSQYNALPNQQKNFTIHGVSPTETSTLYVSRESDIFDLSKEKIITVVYQYDYDETDGSGNITPISERHVVNIHLTFKSGVPTVEKITKPDIILPGDYTSLREPNVTPGAYEITGGGWELFETSKDAESHTNGVEYTPAFDPLYWYQDGYYVAYYAKSYLGRTYSNSVPVSVANYHDLAEVMSDGNKAHHMYIDNKNVKREPKIYINDYSGIGKNGLDIFKNLYDLTLRTEVATSGDLKDHALLDNRVKAGDNLQFFLRTDINRDDDPAVADEWTPIASGVSDPCFEGTLHGDGHTISGLDNSLFGKLCGSVYNLGVTGSFTSAGIADTGKGYVESCWIKTTGTPDGSVRAVFGNPTADSNYKQIVNSYYQAGKTYSTTDTDNHGLATAMEDKAFYNGELAYDLNNFYLYKRFCDKASDSEFSASPVRYNFWLPDNDELQEGRYAQNEELCSSGYNGIQYVEDRFQDGDFRYAAGSIPESEDIRYFKDTEDNDKEYWFPIWPNDYLFFGQALNYDHVVGLSHQNVPTAIRRSGGWIDDSESGNRVYRAPAYFRSKTMGVAHFNSNAVFAQSKKNDAATIAYKNMTAIDFTGSNGDVAGGYDKGLVSSKFYPPLLDDEGLTGFRNIDLTRNLLVYTPETGTTATTVSNYLTEYEVEESTEGYRSIDRQETIGVHGHWIQQSEGGFLATRDQLLVDLNDFNAPMAYDFTNDKRMWYQRTPEDEEFVDRNKGWQGISLPFTAELVTTSEKGEITHFYDGSETSKNETGSKIGHEYWLRQYRDISGVDVAEQRMARFTYPAKSDGAVMQKTTDYNAAVTNTFLWDYYYNATTGHNHKDYNKDTYQEYYKEARQYADYPMLKATTPYLIGFPGKTYFEFDLSGTFSATTTASPNPAKLTKQTISFVSQKNISIGVSDDDIAEATTASTKNGYAFVPSFMSQSVAAGENTYTLKGDGSSYDKVPAAPGDATTVQPFRPYFAAVASPTKEYKYETRSILFSNDEIGDLHPDEDLSDELDKGNLEIYAKGKKIYTISHLKENINIVIVNASGATLTAYTLEPGMKVATPVNTPGAYIVNKKKLIVK
ncbi:MAG: hypothetical protein J6P55_04735 [Bacteroidaceae bacterium]|nr:hypothetical protein [Bacteroidaceae bacterium]